MLQCIVTEGEVRILKRDHEAVDDSMEGERGSRSGGGKDLEQEEGPSMERVEAARSCSRNKLPKRNDVNSFLVESNSFFFKKR